jgi:hypothetical protein
VVETLQFRKSHIHSGAEVTGEQVWCCVAMRCGADDRRLRLVAAEAWWWKERVQIQAGNDRVDDVPIRLALVTWE